MPSEKCLLDKDVLLHVNLDLDWKGLPLGNAFCQECGLEERHPQDVLVRNEAEPSCLSSFFFHRPKKLISLHAAPFPDITPPVLNCPRDIWVNTDPGLYYATLNLTMPLGTGKVYMDAHVGEKVSDLILTSLDLQLFTTTSLK